MRRVQGEGEERERGGERRKREREENLGRHPSQKPKEDSLDNKGKKIHNSGYALLSVLGQAKREDRTLVAWCSVEIKPKPAVLWQWVIFNSLEVTDSRDLEREPQFIRQPCVTIIRLENQCY